MDVKTQKENAKHFAQYWKNRGYEKGESQSFWLALLRDVLGVTRPEEHIVFEEQVHLDHTSFIDGHIPETKVMIEQKSADKDLSAPIRQSDGTYLTPYKQAVRYISELPVSQHPLYVIVCNFKEFWIFDMEKPNGDPEILKLENLPQEFYRLEFLVNKQDTHIQQELDLSVVAGEIVGKLYDALLKQYPQPVSDQDLHSLNVLCVRLVFCLYAENAGIFGGHTMFYDYMVEYPTQQMRFALEELFKVLDQPEDQRDKHLKTDFPKRSAFPYVNGGLFSRKEDIDIPPFTDEIRDLLLEQASAGFDWSGISPTIFGAVFESTLNPETRRSGGMHYTSVENIHKVIDPLFLDDLKSEFIEIQQIDVERTRRRKLEEFQKKLAGLTFLDPACGSGNFLTETYLCLRRLENDVLRELSNQITIGDVGFNPIKVTLDNFYGIEINDFAVSVAMTALWIAESQMLQQTEDIVHSTLDFLPLKTNTGIRHGNALRMDWNEVIQNFKVSYILGNPPFVGKKYQTKEQKADMKVVFGPNAKGIGNLDYVTAWYKKSADYMTNTNIVSAFVSTNSIVQGEHIPLFWKPLYEKYNINIVFAYRTFRWDNEAKDKAAVHCVIIGFSLKFWTKEKTIYLSNGELKHANNIHPYLIDMPNVFIENRSKPLFKCSALVYGSFALDDGNYTISEEEYHTLIQKEPEIEKYLKLFIGSEEFINGKRRYCIWLKNANIKEVRNSKILSKRVENVKEWRSKSGRKETVEASKTPMLFAEIRQPDSDYMAIPITSSERRQYIPMGYMTKDIIASNHLLVLPDATLYDFGILMSTVHMAWMRVVAGRMKSDYNYSARIVYNNFPWPDSMPEQKIKIEETAQAILDARALYPDLSLADLYDNLTIPEELQKAHQDNNRAVAQAYGFAEGMTEEDYVAELMKMYQQMTEK